MMFFQSRQEESRDLLNDILIMGHSWLICCTSEDPDDFSTYIFENVTRYATDGYFAYALKNPVFIEYGISRSESGKYPYRIHDSLMVPVRNEKMISTLFAPDSISLFNSETDMTEVIIKEKCFYLWWD